MIGGPRYATLQDYLDAIRRQRLVIVVTVLVFGGAAFGLSVSQEPAYRAESSLSFRDPADYLTFTGVASSSAPLSPATRATNGADRVTRPQVMRRVRDGLDTTASLSQLRSALSVRVKANTYFVAVTAESDSATFSARLADETARQAVAQETAEYRREVRRSIRAQERALRRTRTRNTNDLAQAFAEQRLAQLRSLANTAQPVLVNKLADVPSSPISPKPIRTTLLGVLLGLTIGLLLAFARDSLDRRLRDSVDIQSQLELPLIGVVSRDILTRRDGDELSDERLEPFRIMRTNIDFLGVDDPPRRILVSSAVPEEGKSTVAASLARVYAAGGRSTLLIECDLHQPSLAARLQMSASPGLSDYLLGKATPQEVVQTIAVPGFGRNGSAPEGEAAAILQPGTLAYISAGASVGQPAALLASQRFKDFLAQVSEAYDVVVLDTPPLLPVGDTLELAPLVDAVVLCVRSGQTSRDQALAARAALERLSTKQTALVVTGVSEDRLYAGYAYKYGAYAQ